MNISRSIYLISLGNYRGVKNALWWERIPASGGLEDCASVFLARVRLHAAGLFPAASAQGADCGSPSQAQLPGSPPDPEVLSSGFQTIQRQEVFFPSLSCVCAHVCVCMCAHMCTRACMHVHVVKNTI